MTPNEYIEQANSGTTFNLALSPILKAVADPDISYEAFQAIVNATIVDRSHLFKKLALTTQQN